MLILARTTPIEEVKKHSEGLSLFYTKLDRNYVDIREIDKLGRGRWIRTSCSSTTCR